MDLFLSVLRILHGNTYDRLRNPIEVRSCRQLLCALLFVVVHILYILLVFLYSDYIMRTALPLIRVSFRDSLTFHVRAGCMTRD